MANDANVLDVDFATLKYSNGKFLYWNHQKLKNYCIGCEKFLVTNAKSANQLAVVREALGTDWDALGNTALHCVCPSNGSVAKLHAEATFLKSLLRLGLDPDTHGVGSTCGHLFTAWGEVELVRVVSVCRPSLSLKDKDDRTLEQEAMFRFSKGKSDDDGNCVANITPYLHILGIWQKLARDGFPSIARLAHDQKWWAVQNLTRREVVSGEEAAEKYRGKTAIEWAKTHGQQELAQELGYLLSVEDEPNDAESVKKDDELKEVLLSSITQLREENEELKEQIASLNQKVQQLSGQKSANVNCKEHDRLLKKVTLLEQDLKQNQEEKKKLALKMTETKAHLQDELMKLQVKIGSLFSENSCFESPQKRAKFDW